MGKKLSILVFVITVSSIVLMAIIRLTVLGDQMIPGYPFVLDRFLLEMRSFGNKTTAQGQTAKQVLQILEKRMLNFGIKNFSLDQKGTDKLQIDIYNPAFSLSRLRELLLQIGSVEFGLLMDRDTLLKIGGAMNRYQKSAGQTTLLYLHPDDVQALIVPVDMEASLKKFLKTGKARSIIGNPSLSIVQDRSIIDDKNYKYLQIYLVKKYKNINQDHIIDVQVKKGYSFGEQLNFTFDEKGRKILSDLTKDYKGERLVIISEGRVIASPVMQDKITDGKIALSVSTSGADFQILQATIKSGLLPIPLHIINESTEIGPQNILSFF